MSDLDIIVSQENILRETNRVYLSHINKNGSRYSYLFVPMIDESEKSSVGSGLNGF